MRDGWVGVSKSSCGAETLAIRQATTLLNVHSNTVRNRIKSGLYHADKVITEHGETYVIPRSELSQESPPNNLPSPLPSQPLPDDRETMQVILEPFVRELGVVREELQRFAMILTHTKDVLMNACGAVPNKRSASLI